MKSIGLLLLTAVVGMAGCKDVMLHGLLGGGSTFDFNGIWSFQKSAASRVCDWTLPSERVQIVQKETQDGWSGTSLTWTFLDGSNRPLMGICNPDNESLNVRYTSSNGADVMIYGHPDNHDITITVHVNHEGCSDSAKWTLQQISE